MRNLFTYLPVLFVLILAASCAKSPGPAIGYHPKESAPAKERVFFPFDSAMLTEEAQDSIRLNSKWLLTEPDTYIILEGHCDDIGKNEYNVELGDRRARAVKAAMMEEGVLQERIIMVVSYGSGRPLSDGRKIEDLRKNRRVEFVVR